MNRKMSRKQQLGKINLIMTFMATDHLKSHLEKINYMTDEDLDAEYYAVSSKLPENIREFIEEYSKEEGGVTSRVMNPYEIAKLMNTFLFVSQYEMYLEENKKK